MELYAYREGNALLPADAESAAVLAKFRMGQPVRVEARQGRNAPRHRLYWVMCQRIANAVGTEPENISDLLKIETGHCTILKTSKGIVKLPRSISYAKMDDAAHRDFFERCVAVIQTEWAISRPDLMRELSDILTPTEQR